LLAEALCGHSLWRDIQHAAGELAGPVVFKDELRTLRSKLGVSHEQKWLERLAALGINITEIGADGADGERIARTIAAMQAGAEAIHGGRIAFGRWNGEPDLLIRADVIRRIRGAATPSGTSDSATRYEAGDMKLSGDLAVTALLQVGLYAELLDLIQGIAVTDRHQHEMHFFLGAADEDHDDGELQGLHSWSTAAVGAYVRRHMRNVEVAWDNNGASLPADPEPVDYCGRGAWERNCDAVWREKRDLVLVAGLRRDERRSLLRVGVETVGALAGDPPVAVEAIPEPERRSHLVRQADMQEKSLNLPVPLHELRPPTRGVFEREEVRRGFARLPAAGTHGIYLDFERYDFNEREGGGLESRAIMAGIAVDAGDAEASSASYLHAFAPTPDDERLMFEELVTIIRAHLARVDGDEDARTPVFHFSAFEPSTFARLSEEYGIGGDLLDKIDFVDLRDITVRVATIGVETYSLKELERLTKYERSVPLKEVQLAAIQYYKYLMAETEAEANTHKQLLVGYNEDDCRSLIHLRAWLESIRAAYTEQYPTEEWGPLPRPERIRKNTERAIRMQEEWAELQRRLDLAVVRHRELAEEAGASGVRHLEEWHRWCADLAGFHMRERAGAFLDRVRHYTLPGYSLHDEPKAIGNVTVHSEGGYTFPEQLITLHEGSSVESAVGERIHQGKITTLDQENRRVWIDWGGDEPRECPTTILESDTFVSSGPEKAMADFAEHAFRGPAADGVPKTVASLLWRTPPAWLEELNASGGVGSEIGLEAAKRLQPGEVLVVQGPPGTGKSHLGGRIIKALVERGELVGVTTQSHAAYQIPIGKAALPPSMVRIADDGHPVWKKATAKKLADWLDDQTAGVSGGTKHTFSHPDVAGQLDVLIVDEAGQYALADLIAISRCAKKIIRLGDPQQLPMVTQAHHPAGPSGLSSINHWIGDGDIQTVDQRAGVFLERTYRLHPAIADFIGDTFYEGRLQIADPAQENLGVRLNVGGTSRQVSPLTLIPVDHSDEGSWSLVEAQAIARFVFTLVSQGEVILKSGARRPFASAALEPGADPTTAPIPDILIVTPYSAQVERIEFALGQQANQPAGIDLRPYTRVLTVDKAQGDEAHVAIYSMVRSAVQGARHGAEFILSANRFNVAVSRAEAVAVVVASPKLLDENPSGPKHVKALNPFAALMERAEVRE
ncbi:MAG: AAA domain-containing protein, partial [Candidatus Limnocylindrus sp.]